MVQQAFPFTELYVTRWVYSDTQQYGLQLSVKPVRDLGSEVFKVSENALDAFAYAYSWKIFDSAFDRRFFNADACIASLMRCVANVGDPEVTRTDEADEFVLWATNFFRDSWDSLQLEPIREVK